MGQDESTMLDHSVPPHSLTARTLEAVAEYIKGGRTKRIVVLTGAGISTAAGIPDFRSPKTGLYSNLARLNLPYAEAVFDISYFREHPEPFYVLASELYPGKFFPTVSHAFIALVAEKGLLQMLFTQNIDCLERRAGVPAEKIIEAHGSFATQRCIECKVEFPDDKMKEHIFASKVPHCEETGCNGLVKPDIVFFGEALPKAFDRNAHQTQLADLVLILGTSLTVYPFAGLPDMASPGKPRVLFNMERVGKIGSRTDDVIELGSCDEGVRKLADLLGWRDELEALWRKTVGDKEADRQSRSREAAEDDVEDEVHKLAAEVEAALNLEDSDSREGKASRIARLLDDALGPKYEAKAEESKSDDQVDVSKKKDVESAESLGAIKVQPEESSKSSKPMDQIDVKKEEEKVETGESIIVVPEAKTESTGASTKEMDRIDVNKIEEQVETGEPLGVVPTTKETTANSPPQGEPVEGPTAPQVSKPAEEPKLNQRESKPAL